ncbi:TPA: hypothetical protein RQJ43_004486 [Vibrio vulnificus]|nr:hypothetical protein [Vibrio vulnificus]HDY7438632.1 hypothetical protein [Vibrio vulnificus]
MIKVEYILDGQAGELELSGLTGFDSLADALSVHGSETVSDALAKYLLEDVMANLKPEVAVASNMHACSRGGERNKEESESVKASSLGFTKLVGFFEGKKIFVV